MHDPKKPPLSDSIRSADPRPSSFDWDTISFLSLQTYTDTRNIQTLTPNSLTAIQKLILWAKSPVAFRARSFSLIRSFAPSLPVSQPTAVVTWLFVLDTLEDGEGEFIFFAILMDTTHSLSRSVGRRDEKDDVPSLLYQRYSCHRYCSPPTCHDNSRADRRALVIRKNSEIQLQIDLIIYLFDGFCTASISSYDARVEI